MDELISVLSHRAFKFSWVNLTNVTRLEIVFPNLSHAQWACWGDWGPMFQLNFISSEEKPQIIYDGDEVSVVSNLSIESPAKAQERERWPLQIIIEDPIKGLVFQLYLEQSFEVNLVKILNTSERVKVTEFIISESDMAGL